MSVKQASNLKPIRIRTASDILALLESTLNDVRAETADTFTKARVLGYLASIALKAVETCDLEVRVQQLEEASERRKAR